MNKLNNVTLAVIFFLCEIQFFITKNLSFDNFCYVRSYEKCYDIIFSWFIYKIIGHLKCNAQSMFPLFLEKQNPSHNFFVVKTFCKM